MLITMEGHSNTNNSNNTHSTNFLWLQCQVFFFPLILLLLILSLLLIYLFNLYTCILLTNYLLQFITQGIHSLKLKQGKDMHEIIITHRLYCK